MKIISDTTLQNEQAYVEHVIDFVRTNPLAEAIYIFEAFDESEKPGSETEKHFGVMVKIMPWKTQLFHFRGFFIVGILIFKKL